MCADRTPPTLTLAAALGLALAAGAAPAGEKDAPPGPDKQLIERIGRAEAVMIAKVASATYGPVGASEPAYWTLTLQFKDARALKGDFDPKPGCFYAVRQAQQPMFSAKDTFVFLLGKVNGKWRVGTILDGTAGNIRAAEAATGSSAVPPKDPAPDAAGRLKAVKDNLDGFSLTLMYLAGADEGASGERITRLILNTTPVKRAEWSQSWREAVVSKELAGKLVDHLAASGFFAAADDISKTGPQPYPAGPCYTLTVRAGTLVLRRNLGWGAALDGRLDALRAAAAAAELPADLLCPSCKDKVAPTGDVGACKACGKAVTPGSLKYCQACSRKLAKCRRCEASIAGPATRVLDELLAGLADDRKGWQVQPPPEPTTRPDPTAAEIAALINQLGHADFKVREAATKKLIAVGEAARGALEAAAEKKSLDPEVAARIEYILRQLIPKVGTSVTEPISGITLRLDHAGRVITATREGKVVWQVTLAARATRLILSGLYVIVEPGRYLVEARTGRIIHIRLPLPEDDEGPEGD